MSHPTSFRCLWLTALLAVALCPFAHAAAGPQTPLSGSIREVEAAPASGQVNPHKPFISRKTLRAEESAATMDFEVALKMRNFAELQARVNRGERISPQEMAEKYEPSVSDYRSVVAWLKGEGFTITRQGKSRLAVFARGTVSQIGQALNVNFARVQLEGREYTSAISAPSVPAALAPLLVGINGLQPHLHPRKHIVRPNSLNGTNPPYLPRQIAQAYNATGLYNSQITGSGQTIAIVIDLFPATSDLVSYWKIYGVNQSLANIQFVQVIAGTMAAPTGEETIDAEWSSSIAPGAKVRVYGTTTLDNNSFLDQAYQQVYEDATTNPGLGIHQMSMSYGIGETYPSSSQVTTDDQYFAQLASAGVTIFASSGDSGSTPGPGPSNPDESGPLQVNSPASDPNVTGVGGTSLVLNSSGSESSESVWNNGATDGATGGGVSEIFSRPSWQAGTGVPAGSMRLVPDLACSANPNNGAVVFLNGSSVQYGGTSWSSPTMAGFCALLNQARADAGMASIGLLGPHIYPLIGTNNFRDITTGNNATSSSNGLYAATVGYDEATGVGVPLVQTLAQTLVGSSPLLGVQVQPPAQSVVPGATATVTASAGGTPGGYQWQRMPAGSTAWSNLTDGGAYTRSATATLTVSGATTVMSGDEFQCVVSYPGSPTLITTPSVLAVETPLIVNTLAGSVLSAGSANGKGAAATFNYPSGIALDASGDLFIADFSNNSIREITPAGVVTTPYGSPLKTPNGIASDSSNNLYVADTGNNLIRKISGGVISTIGSSVRYKTPSAVAVDNSGNVYVADSGNDLVRKITPSGTVTTLAGRSGVAGYLNGNGTGAEFNNPAGVAVDGSGNVYVADFNNDVVRKITSGGAVTTLAGQPGVAGELDGVGASALFNAPNNVMVDGSNNVYVTDSLVPPTTSTVAGNNLLRRISPSGVVTTLAGQAGVTGSANGTGSSAQFYSVQAAAITSGGEIYLADTYNQIVRAAGLAPSIATQPLAQLVTAGQAASFFVAASGTGPFSYQWRKDGVDISGATSSTYPIASAATGDTGGYSVVVSNSFGNATSSSVSLVVVTSQPMAETATSGNSATFSIAVSGTGAPYSFQWLFNGNAISGATNSSYAIPNVSSANAGNYSVIVSDIYGTVTTSPVSLTVNPGPDLAAGGPTMPQWMLILFGALLFLVAAPRPVGKQRA